LALGYRLAAGDTGVACLADMQEGWIQWGMGPVDYPPNRESHRALAICIPELANRSAQRK
jgi:hypothetical protein